MSDAERPKFKVITGGKEDRGNTFELHFKFDAVTAAVRAVIAEDTELNQTLRDQCLAIVDGLSLEECRAAISNADDINYRDQSDNDKILFWVRTHLLEKLQGLAPEVHPGVPLPEKEQQNSMALSGVLARLRQRLTKSEIIRGLEE